LQLAKCEHLAISSNNIEKVTGLKGLKSLKILSLGRNLIKKFDGIGPTFFVSIRQNLHALFHRSLLFLMRCAHTRRSLAHAHLSPTDEVADSLEQLWISYNLIEKMAGVEALNNLRVLYMSNNLVSKWAEVFTCMQMCVCSFCLLSFVL
jgi:dynein light chain 1